MIPRLVLKNVISALDSFKKIILIFGPRQSGKTTLLNMLRQALKKPGARILYLNCDSPENRSLLDTTSLQQLEKLLKGVSLLLIDEAQRLSDPGLTLKIIYDNISHVRVIATGSSSFELKNSLTDALTGRYISFTLYPFSFAEVVNDAKTSENLIVKQKQAEALLEERLLYGCYPDVVLQNNPNRAITLLGELMDNYLFKDIFSFGRIRRPEVIIQLTRALAYQIGSEVNENELANRLKIDRKTVLSYLDALEQSFVIIRVYPYSTNPRREIGRRYKIFFVDLGIRNALIGDFNALSVRSDLGKLWENFVIMERLKMGANMARRFDYYFWRTYSGAEVDWIEKYPNQPMSAFEFKYTAANLSKGAKIFTQTYNLPVAIVNRENILDFL